MYSLTEFSRKSYLCCGRYLMLWSRIYLPYILTQWTIHSPVLVRSWSNDSNSLSNEIEVEIESTSWLGNVKIFDIHVTPPPSMPSCAAQCCVIRGFLPFSLHPTPPTPAPHNKGFNSCNRNFFKHWCYSGVFLYEKELCYRRSNRTRCKWDLMWYGTTGVLEHV